MRTWLRFPVTTRGESPRRKTPGGRGTGRGVGLHLKFLIQEPAQANTTRDFTFRYRTRRRLASKIPHPRTCAGEHHTGFHFLRLYRTFIIGRERDLPVCLAPKWRYR